jgi:predicted ATPase
MYEMKLISAEIIKDINPLKPGIKVSFDAEICFIVGDNGVGKSTLIECIADHFGYEDETYMKRKNMKDNVLIEKSDVKFPFKYIDFHGDDKKFSGTFGNDMSLQLMQMRASSGQVSISLINKVLGDIPNMKGSLVVLDEPCRGQSIKNKLRMVTVIRNLAFKLDCQVIVTTHSDWILSAFDGIAQYFDIVANKNTTYKEYINSQLL